MKVLNVHERELDATAEGVGQLIDLLASEKDVLWPYRYWPRMKFDRPLGVGASGGHGPIRYVVEEYTPGQFVQFRFTAPKGFNGFHAFEVKVLRNKHVKLRHRLRMETNGLAVFSWFFVFEPLHDALIEDSLSTAEVSLGLSPKTVHWSLWVRFLRWFLSGFKLSSQVRPE
jgi:hypothetical protein